MRRGVLQPMRIDTPRARCRLDTRPGQTLVSARAPRAVPGGPSVLWTIIGILILLWLVGLVSNVVGGIIHILLVVALVVFVYQLLAGRRSV